MKCLDNFKGVPVLVQLKNVIAAAISAEEVTVDEEAGDKCGAATVAFFPGEDGKTPTPVQLQVLRGEIEEVDETHLVFATMGGDNRTPVRICLELDNVAAVTFCVEHVPAEQPSTILKP